MDIGSIQDNLPLILLIAAVILIPMFFRRRLRPMAAPQEVVRNLLSEVKLDLSLAEVYIANGRVKKFETVSWQLNKNKIDFLGQSVRAALTDAFTLADDYNQQVAAAKKHRSDYSIANINIEKLKGSLTDSKDGLEEWLVAKVGTKEPPVKYPGLFDGLFGGGN